MRARDYKVGHIAAMANRIVKARGAVNEDAKVLAEWLVRRLMNAAIRPVEPSEGLGISAEFTFRQIPSEGGIEASILDTEGTLVHITFDREQNASLTTVYSAERFAESLDRLLAAIKQTLGPKARTLEKQQRKLQAGLCLMKL